jgi:hypothetical protein
MRKARSDSVEVIPKQTVVIARLDRATQYTLAQRVNSHPPKQPRSIPIALEY